MLKAKLVVVGGDAKAKEVNLKLPCVIGRGREATLTLPHPLVSRLHTEIFEQEGHLFVKDLGSLNGTFLNNKRLESEQPLLPNQLLTLGNVTFRAVYEIDGEQVDTDGEGETLLETMPVSSRLDADTVPVEDETIRTDPKPRTPERQTVFDDDKEPSASDTDMSLVDDEDIAAQADESRAAQSSVKSDVFSGVETGQDQPSKVSSVDGLPEGNVAMSFAGGIDMGEAARKEKIGDAVDLEIEGAPAKKDASASRLDSFLKKLPK